jgi:hypothetical protein
VNWIQTTLEDFHAGIGFHVDVKQRAGSITLYQEGDNYITEGTADFAINIEVQSRLQLIRYPSVEQRDANASASIMF